MQKTQIQAALLLCIPVSRSKLTHNQHNELQQLLKQAGHGAHDPTELQLDTMNGQWMGAADGAIPSHALPQVQAAYWKGSQYRSVLSIHTAHSKACSGGIS